MQISKKHLLGLGGLAVVAATTAYAATIPTPNAGAASAGGNAEVVVDVYSSNPQVEITSIKDGDVFTTENLYIENTYSDASKIEYVLYKKTDHGLVYADLGENAEYIPPTFTESGRRGFNFNLNSSEDLGYGEYVVEVTVYSGSSKVQDMVSFKYVPVKLTVIGEDENGDLVVDVDYDENVNTFDVQLTDENGNPILDPALTYKVDNPGVAGSMRLTIPLGTNYGLKPGTYNVLLTARDRNGRTLYEYAAGQITYTAPDVPDVPRTGGFLNDLNISNTDYLITGLVIFGLFTVFAIAIIRKQSRR